MFFGIDWLIGLIKISFQIVFAILTAFPAVYAWNCVAPVYLSFIPVLYQHIPYWHVVAIFLTATYVGEIVGKLTPTLIRIEQKNENKKG